MHTKTQKKDKDMEMNKNQKPNETNAPHKDTNKWENSRNKKCLFGVF